MTNTTHAVSPEELMAYVDEELPPAELRLIGAHLEQCTECMALAAEFRSLSATLAGWEMPPVSADFDHAVIERAAVAGRGRSSQRRSRWGAGRTILWAFGCAAVMLSFCFVLLPLWRRLPRNDQISPGLHGSSSRAENATDTDAVMRAYASRSGLNALRDHASSTMALSDESSVRQPLSQERGLAAREQEPMIARTISLTILVKDVQASRLALESILARHHGYYAQMTSHDSGDLAKVLQASLRIPAPELSVSLVELKGLGIVQEESQSGEEVTKQHQDIIARLKISRETEQRFLEILQRRPDKVADLLEVEQNIARVRGDIERIEAEQKALEHRVDFASVEVFLNEDPKTQTTRGRDSVFTRIQVAFAEGYRNAVGTVVGIILFVAEYGLALLIWLAVLVTPSVFLWRRYRRNWPGK